MAEYLIQDTTLDAIADAINAKTGGSSAMTPAEMVTEIASIPTGGGGALPSFISKIGGGTFTVETATVAKYKEIQHGLNTTPKGFVIWSDDVFDESSSDTSLFIIYAIYVSVQYVYSADTKVGYWLDLYRRQSDGRTSTSAGMVTASTVSNFVDSSSICLYSNDYFQSGKTYKWVAWA